jgi:hypothetical protein
MPLTTATRSGSRPGGCRNKMPLTMLNIVALIPIPNASVSTAIVVNPGFFSNCRKPYRRS